MTDAVPGMNSSARRSGAQLGLFPDTPRWPAVSFVLRRRQSCDLRQAIGPARRWCQVAARGRRPQCRAMQECDAGLRASARLVTVVAVPRELCRLPWSAQIRPCLVSRCEIVR